MILASQIFFCGEMQGFLSWKFFSGAGCIDSCLPEIFLGRDSLILAFGAFWGGKNFFRFFLAYSRYTL